MLLAICAAALLSPAIALAEPGDPPITLLGPQDGAQVVAGTSVTFTFTCPSYRLFALAASPNANWTYYFADIATRPDRGPNGQLALAFTVDSFGAFPTNADETECRGTSAFAPAIGTYYWQVFRVCGETMCPDDDFSPVYSFTAASPPSDPQPPPAAPAPPSPPTSPPAAPHIASSEVHPDAVLVIRHQTGKRPRQLTLRCHRITGASVKCKASWTDDKNTWQGDLGMHQRASFLSYSFVGYRATRACLRHKSLPACRHRVRW